MHGTTHDFHLNLQIFKITKIWKISETTYKISSLLRTPRFRTMSHDSYQLFGDQMYHTQMHRALVTKLENTNHFILEGINFMSMLILCTRMTSGVQN